MSLAPGTRLGPYEILGPLGEGGMGEVYLARDTRLGREVAVKVLRGKGPSDPARLARFEREARLLASVSHPNVATIHDLDLAGSPGFLVLELVPGRTIEERLADGPLSVREALEIGVAIAEALEAAHAKGIVHRDLKPANVKITPDGRIKVLDFGLAKVLDLEEEPVDRSRAETLGPDATMAGFVVGTPSYMSPEQVRGGRADARSDLYALGCVLLECLTGRRAFPGASLVEVVAAILDAKPPLEALPPEIPDRVRRLLARCLASDPAARPKTAEAVRRELASALRDLSDPTRDAAPAARIIQATFSESLEGFPSFSHDGGEIVFSRDVSRVRKLFRKRIGDDAETQVTRGEHDDIQPAWSPDGRAIWFVRSRKEGRRLEPRDVFGQFEDADLFRLDLDSGKETRVVENAFNPAFSPDGASIAVDASWAGPRRIWIVDAGGRNPRQVTTDSSEAVAHVRPRFSPDGAAIVFQNIERTKQDVRGVVVATGRLFWVTQDLYQDFHPCFASSGRFVYFSSYRSGGLNLWRVLVDEGGAPQGASRQVTVGPGQDVEAAVSPDGRRLAFTILRQNADLWKLPVDPRTGEPAGAPQKVLASSREESRGAWSPDGTSVAFNSDRAGDMNIWLLTLADGKVRQVTRGAGGDYQPCFSPDGGTLVFFSSRSGTPAIWSVELASGRLERLTPGTAISINPFYSPDGGVIAYQSDEGGRLEVWRMSPDGSEPRPLTDVGVMGHFLRFTEDGRHVVFRCPGNGAPATWRVPTEGGAPEPLGNVAGGAHMSFSPDRTRILDVVGHKALWVSPLDGGEPRQVFEFEVPDVRIDYPVWSPDGRFVLFDRFRPQGGDIFILEELE